MLLCCKQDRTPGTTAQLCAQSVCESVQVEAAQSSAKTLLELQAETKAYQAALEAVRSQYVASDRVTDFKKDLQQHADRMVPTFRFEHSHHTVSLMHSPSCWQPCCWV